MVIKKVDLKINRTTKIDKLMYLASIDFGYPWISNSSCKGVSLKPYFINFNNHYVQELFWERKNLWK